MSRIGGYRKTNCSLDAPGFGRMDIVIETLGHGMSIVGNEGEGRRYRAYYPYVRTSGSWYVEAVFPEVSERDALHWWLLQYTAAITDPYRAPRYPMTVSVPARQFVKVGYPTGAIDFGDRFGVGKYSTMLSFTSATDPSVSSVGSSRYVPPLNDQAAKHFYPAGIQETTLPPPTPSGPGLGDESPWDSPSKPSVTPVRYS